MKLINGSELAKHLDIKIQNLIHSPKISPKKLAIVQIGDEESSNAYIKIKQKVAEKLQITVDLYKYKNNNPLNLLINDIKKICNEPKYSSVIIQLPLPTKEHYKLLNLIPIEKDIDMLSHKSQQLFYSDKAYFNSPIVRATEYILDTLNLDFKKTNALVVGSGFLVGKPVIHLLKNKGLKVNYTNNFSKRCVKNKKLIILSTGVCNLVKGEYLEPMTSVIDFGYSRLNNKPVGDLNMQSKINHLDHIIPSPNGMGPLVVRFLLMNHLRI